MDPMVAFRPTTALPGSEEKIQIMELRFSLRLPLFHPLDAKIDRKGRLRLAFDEGIADGED